MSERRELARKQAAVLDHSPAIPTQKGDDDSYVPQIEMREDAFPGDGTVGETMHQHKRRSLRIAEFQNN